MNHSQTPNRRRFERIPFEHSVLISVDAVEYDGELLDISFRGALLALNDAWRPTPAQAVTLIISLADSDDLQIRMAGSVVRIADREIAVRCEEMDIESMTLLRRLVEMNLGDPGMLERELGAFLD